MAYAVYSKSSSLHGNCYKLNTVNSPLIICDFFVNVNNTSNELYTLNLLHVYTLPNHGSSVYGTDP